MLVTCIILITDICLGLGEERMLGRGMTRGKTKTAPAACVIHPTKRHDVKNFQVFSSTFIKHFPVFSSTFIKHFPVFLPERWRREEEEEGGEEVEEDRIYSHPIRFALKFYPSPFLLFLC